MNRKLLALAVGAVVAMPLAAQAAPTLYGKVNVSGDYLSGDSYKDNWELNSNVSRFGLKGDENLGNNTNTSMIGQVIDARFFKVLDYPTASALSVALMVAILLIVAAYVRRAGTEDLL